MRVAVIQMTSQEEVDANLQAASDFVREAAAEGARLVALPENFAYLRREGMPFPCAQDLEGPIMSSMRALARELEIWLLAGTFPERIEGDSRVHNTSVLIDPTGELAAIYRKIHLFDIDLSASGGPRFQESATVAPGSCPVVADTPFGGVGLSVCYDLRFPELYRALVDSGARWLMVPSAFTPETGRDHWEVLLRARAIENQCYVLAPAQFGEHNPKRSSYGRSMIIDPWGLILAQAPDRPAVIWADCPGSDQECVRAALPALRHRRVATPQELP